MSTYVISDIHGEYDKYKEALKSIEFKDTDTLYVLGDIIDRGPNSMKILLDMMMRFNVIPILGNHEYMAMLVLQFLLMEINEDNVDYVERNPQVIENLSRWMNEGGTKTIEEFNTLSISEKYMIIDYLEEFRLNDELILNNKYYVLVYAGLMNFKEERPLEDYKYYECLLHRTDYSKALYKDKFLITGHTPTRFIHTDRSDLVYKNNNHIAIDCGFASGGKLGIIRLDDEVEFYI